METSKYGNHRSKWMIVVLLPMKKISIMGILEVNVWFNDPMWNSTIPGGYEALIEPPSLCFFFFCILLLKRWPCSSCFSFLAKFIWWWFYYVQQEATREDGSWACEFSGTAESSQSEISSKIHGQGGFHGHGGTPKIAGWFISGNIPSFEMDDDWGYPYDETETSICRWILLDQLNT